jgi:hypothetical protein
MRVCALERTHSKTNAGAFAKLAMIALASQIPMEFALLSLLQIFDRTFN